MRPMSSAGAETEMFSQALKTQLVFALLLAMFMAWGGHAAAGLASPVHPLFESADEHDHVPAGDRQVCALCELQHEHAPLSADHLHETPYPTALPKLPTLVEHSLPQGVSWHSLPDAPVFLIERPPRRAFVL